MSLRSWWILFFVLAVVMFIVLCIPFYADYQVYTKGSICKVIITELPAGGGRNNFMNFTKDGMPGYMRVDRNYEQYHKVGDTITLRYLEGYNHHYLFPNENPLYWGAGVLVFFIICAIACMSYALRKDPPNLNSLY